MLENFNKSGGHMNFLLRGVVKNRSHILRRSADLGDLTPVKLDQTSSVPIMMNPFAPMDPWRSYSLEYNR